jgi:hypothetical protein
MAYSPFHSFRKHQKTYFAVLTIVCMFVFVLTGLSGSMQELISFVQGSSRGHVAATIDGKKITLPQINEVRIMRDMASLFMQAAHQRLDDKLMGGIRSQLSKPNTKLDPSTQQVIQKVLFYHSLARQGLGSQQLFIELSSAEQELNLALQQASLGHKVDDERVLQATQMVLLLDSELLPKSPKDFYFGGGKTPRDIIDFMLWQREADRLGIHLTQQDLDPLVAREFHGLLSGSDSNDAFQMIRGNFGGQLTKDMLRDALLREFRVRLAQDTLEGRDQQTRRPPRPDAITPFELWKFYEKNRTESEITMAAIPVNSPELLKKVPEPTDAELKTLYQAGKDREPDPASPLASFKQPMRITIEWVKADSTLPFYHRLAKIEAAAIQATMPLAYALAVDNGYDQLKDKHPMPNWLSSEGLPMRSSREAPQAIIGIIGAGAAPVIGPVAALEANAGLTTAVDLGYRTRRVATLIGSLGQGSLLLSLVNAYHDTPKTDYEPPSMIQADLAAALEDRLADELARKSLDQVSDYLTSHASDKTQSKGPAGEASAIGLAIGQVTPGLAFLAPALYQVGAAVENQKQQLVEATGAAASMSPWISAAFAWASEKLESGSVAAKLPGLIQKLGLEHGATSKPRDVFEIASDPGLAPVKKAFLPGFDDNSNRQADKQFAEHFFSTGEGLYKPDRGIAQYLTWRTSEEPAYVPDFSAIRQNVLARWKLEKARKLAAEEAEKIAADARKAKGDAERNLRDAAKRFGRLIYLDKVAKLVPSPEPVMSRFGGRTFEEYKIPRYDVEYPTSDMTEKLLDMKERGDVIVLHDEPELNYYVATLVRRAEPHELSFYADASRPEWLLSHYEQSTDYAGKLRQSVLDQLRREARVEYFDDVLKGTSSGNPSSE